TKASDAQLYLNVFHDRVECGFYIGTRAQDVRATFLEAVQRQANLVAELLEDVTRNPDLSVMVSDGEHRATPGRSLDVGSAAELIDAYDSDARIGRTFSRTDPIVGSPDLVDAIADAFHVVYPFFLLATSEKPTEAIEAFRASHDQEEQGTDAGPDGHG